MRVVLLAAGDRDGLRMRIDTVLDELRDRFQGIALRERDDADRVPIIPDAQFAAIFAFRSHDEQLWVNWKACPDRAPSTACSATRVRLTGTISRHAALNSRA